MSLLLTCTCPLWTKHVTDTSGINHKNSNNLKKKHLKQSFLLREQQRIHTQNETFTNSPSRSLSVCVDLSLSHFIPLPQSRRRSRWWCSGYRTGHLKASHVINTLSACGLEAEPLLHPQPTRPERAAFTCNSEGPTSTFHSDGFYLPSTLTCSAWRGLITDALKTTQRHKPVKTQR